MTTKNIQNATPYTFLMTLKKYDNTKEGLAAIAAEYNLRTDNAIVTAERIYSAVKDFDDYYDEVQQDTAAAMNKFFKAIEKKTSTERISILNRVAFNLEAFTEGDIIEKLENGASIHTLYNEFCGDDVLEDSLENELRLRDRILVQAETMNLSPKATRRIAKTMARNEYFADNAAAIGKELFQVKCAAALYAYLRADSAITPEEAAAHIGSHMYMQAAADSVRLGDITEDVASLAILLVIFTAVAFVELALLAVGANYGFQVFGILLTFVGLLCVFEGMERNIAVQVEPLMEKGMEKIHDGFERIASYLEGLRNQKNQKRTDTYSDNFIIDLDCEEDLEEDVYVF